jgi:hypothetical protein
VWRVKVVAEFETGETTEVEVARLERDEQAGLADLGLRLVEAKRLTAAIQGGDRPGAGGDSGENRHTCLACGCVLASKGHYTATLERTGCNRRVAARGKKAPNTDWNVTEQRAEWQTLAVAGVTADTPATVLSDGDAGLWRLQRASLPNATVVLDWWHAAVRFEHALQAARGLGAADAHLAAEAVRGLERAKWRLWHGRWPECRRKLAALCRWARHTSLRGLAGIGRLEHHVGELLAYLERNQGGVGPLRRPASEWRTDFDRLRGEFGQRDHRQTHEQKTADALEQGDGAALPRRANSGAERYARGRLPSPLSRLPPRKTTMRQSH